MMMVWEKNTDFGKRFVKSDDFPAWYRLKVAAGLIGLRKRQPSRWCDRNGW
jgi:hypothetical protein